MSETFLHRKKRELGVQLNPAQTKAVLQTEGPMLLLASPGSGKTTTLIMRIGYLIEEKGIDPTRIKAVTFSRASANDMKERFKKFFPQLTPVDFSTIHSLAFQVVREHFRNEHIQYELIEGPSNKHNQGRAPINKRILLRNIFKTMNDDNITEDQLEELLTYISYIKNKLIPLDKLSSVSCSVPHAEEIFRKYEEFKRNSQVLLVDYDDMLTIANRILENESDLLKKYQRMYDYVLTDESQDTSLVQHLIIEKLVKEHKNLCVVADDDQSIYGWRGAEPQYLLDFKKRYPHAEILKMEQNYRSSKNIVKIANQFIQQNKKRYPKNMFTENKPASEIVRKVLTDYSEQTTYVAEAILKEQNLQEIAVLYRNNSSSILLVNELERANIPFYLKDTDHRFFHHWIVEDMKNFMRMTFNDRKPALLEKIYSKFNGYISKVQVENLKRINNDESVFDNLINHVDIKEYQVRKLKRCKELFSDMRHQRPLKVIQTIRQELEYDKAIEGMCQRLGFNKDNLFGILHTLEEVAAPLHTIEEFAQRLHQLESAMIHAKKNQSANAVTLTTLHSSKGLEFNKVYMIDLIDGVIPSTIDMEEFRHGDTNLMEEAARLFYVGMTRARFHLELISYKSKYGVQTRVSRFFNYVNAIVENPNKKINHHDVAEKPTLEAAKGRKKRIPINPHAIKVAKQLHVGKKVKHNVFGSGEVIYINDDIVELKFERETKKISVHVCLERGLLEPV